MFGLSAPAPVHCAAANIVIVLCMLRQTAVRAYAMVMVSYFLLLQLCFRFRCGARAQGSRGREAAQLFALAD